MVDEAVRADLISRVKRPELCRVTRSSSQPITRSLRSELEQHGLACR